MFQLEKSLGVSTESELGLDKDRNSDPALETRIKDGDLKQIKELNEEKRKSARRKEFIMAELLETERSYVKVMLLFKIVFSRKISEVFLIRIFS